MARRRNSKLESAFIGLAIVAGGIGGIISKVLDRVRAVKSNESVFRRPYRKPETMHDSSRAVSSTVGSSSTINTRHLNRRLDSMRLISGKTDFTP